MFRFHKTLDVITLFHKPTLPASIRIHSLLKQASAMSASTATEDQASDHSEQSRLARSEFQLDVTDQPPTPDQLESIIQYLGPSKIPMIIKGARTPVDAMKKLKEDPESFQRPVTVDWENGRAAAGDNESEILKMIEGLANK